jgi:hypothetical protein
MSRAIRSPEKQIEYQKKRRVLSVLLFVGLGAFVALMIWLPTISSLQIASIVVEGNKVLTKEEVGKEIDRTLSGKYLLIFPKTNILVYPKEDVEKTLREAFPRIKNLQARLDQERVLTVTLTEKEPFALWCGREKAAVDGILQPCAYLDEDGFIFAGAPHFSGDTYFEFYGKGSLQDGEDIGHNFLPPDVFHRVIKIKDEFEGFHIHSVKIFIAEDGGAEFTESAGYGLRFNIDQDVPALLSNMQAVFRSASWGKATVSGTLEYLDFRFGNKVYYKYKNQEGTKEQE